MHYGHEPSIEELLRLDEWNQHRLLRQEVLGRATPWLGAEQERGIIICGGGEKYLPGVWVMLRELRCVGCTLPVEVWYLGEAEMPVAWGQRLGAEPDVFLVDATRVRERHPVRILNGWELKVYANEEVTHCCGQHDNIAGALEITQDQFSGHGAPPAAKW
jgi:hypothetical protein